MCVVERRESRAESETESFAQAESETGWSFRGAHSTPRAWEECLARAQPQRQGGTAAGWRKFIQDLGIARKTRFSTRRL